jgi:hypothetical protein
MFAASCVLVVYYCAFVLFSCWVFIFQVLVDSLWRAHLLLRPGATTVKRVTVCAWEESVVATSTRNFHPLLPCKFFSYRMSGSGAPQGFWCFSGSRISGLQRFGLTAMVARIAPRWSFFWFWCNFAPCWPHYYYYYCKQNWIQSYENLFESVCVVCQRCLGFDSADHKLLPPLQRSYVAPFKPYHTHCLNSTHSTPSLVGSHYS